MGAGRPYSFYVEDRRTGRLRVAFDIIDRDVPYVRRLLGDFMPEDAGPWANLEPDLPALPSPEDDAVQLLLQHARDGEVRARLMDLGVTKRQWESATPESRKAVIEFIRASELADAALVAVLTDPDVRLREAATRLLHGVRDLLERQRNIFNTKDFGSFAFKASTLAHAQRLVTATTELLRLAKQEAAKAKVSGKDLFRSAKWVEAQAQRVNQLVLVPAGAKARNLCTPDNIRKLAGRTQPQTVARELILRAFPDVPSDDLVRGAVRRRPRTKK